MARLFGMIGNRPDLGARALALDSETLRVRSPDSPVGWGLGFYQGGEVLIRRRPVDERPDIDVAELASDVRADVVIGQVRHATTGDLRTENTHPFRYRQWLFAQTGTVPQFDQLRERLVLSVPEFLRSGIRGETDAEAMFHIFLSFLHDAGRLNDANADPSEVHEALRSTLTVLDGMTAEVGGGTNDLNLLVTNGEFIVAVHRSQSQEMRIHTLAGKSDAELVIGDDTALRRRAPEIAQMHFSVVASDFDAQENVPAIKATLARWKVIPPNSVVIMLRGKDPQIVPV